VGEGEDESCRRRWRFGERMPAAVLISCSRQTKRQVRRVAVAAASHQSITRHRHPTGGGGR
jgi:hypothetical protein